MPGTIIAIDEPNGLLIACADGKALKPKWYIFEEGYFTGPKLEEFGLRKGDKFD